MDFVEVLLFGYSVKDFYYLNWGSGADLNSAQQYDSTVIFSLPFKVHQNYIFKSGCKDRLLSGLDVTCTR